jgi:hypothetical protein
LAAEAVELQSCLKKSLKKPPSASRQPGELAADWLAQAGAGPPDLAFAYSALSWAYLLPELAIRLPAGVWWSLVEFLSRTAADAAALSIEGEPLPQQLLSAELPLVLATRLPEVTCCARLNQAGMTALGRGFEEVVSDKGLPHATDLEHWRPLLACWTRSLLVSHSTAKGDPQDTHARFIETLRAALCSMRRDGSPLLGATRWDWRDEELFRAATKVADDAATRWIADALLWGRADRKKKLKKPKRQLPLPGVQCDTAEIAVFRTAWAPNAITMAVRHHRPEIELELHQAGTTLAQGIWQFELDIDGEPCRVQSPWHNVCWICDEDVDYLELEAKLSHGVRVQRQMLLAREDKFLYLADAVIAPGARTIDYCSRLPLAEGVACHPAEEAREVRFEQGKRSGVVLPLALPEWRRDPRGGSLEIIDSTLEFRQSRQATALYAPLWIDLDRSRRNKPLTWRQLTVAQDRQVVSAETAVGYRVQIGRQQWLIYRTLGPRANRTLLGSNLVSEFMLARFTDEGEAQPLLEIE